MAIGYITSYTAAAGAAASSLDCTGVTLFDNEMVAVAIAVGGNGGTPPTVTSVTDGINSYTRVVTGKLNSTGNQVQAELYHCRAAYGMTAGTVTAHLSGTSNGGVAMIVLRYNGVNLKVFQGASTFSGNSITAHDGGGVINANNGFYCDCFAIDAPVTVSVHSGTLRNQILDSFGTGVTCSFADCTSALRGDFPSDGIQWSVNHNLAEVGMSFDPFLSPGQGYGASVTEDYSWAE